MHGKEIKRFAKRLRILAVVAPRAAQRRNKASFDEAHEEIVQMLDTIGREAFAEPRADKPVPSPVVAPKSQPTPASKKPAKKVVADTKGPKSPKPGSKG